MRGWQIHAGEVGEKENSKSPGQRRGFLIHASDNGHSQMPVDAQVLIDAPLRILLRNPP